MDLMVPTPKSIECSNNTYLDIEQMFIYALIPSGALILIFSFSVQRNKLFPTCCNKRPGIIYPYNGTECHEHRLAAVASSAVAVRFMMDFLFGNLLLIPEDTSLSIKALWGMLNVLILCIIYYPLIAAFTIGEVSSYFIGTLYVWLYAAAIFWDKWTYCPINNGNKSLSVAFVEEAPSFLCLLYLMIKLPYNLIRKLQTKISYKLNEEEIPHVQYVRNLLKCQPLGLMMLRGNSRWNSFRQFIYKIYLPIPGFRYSFRILCSLTVGLLIIYDLNVRWFQHLLVLYPLCELSSWDKEPVFIYLSYQCYLNLTCVNVALVLCDVIIIFVTYHILICYRSSLLDIYQGNYRKSYIFNKFSNTSITLGCILYPGYQAANMIWGFVLQIILVSILLITPIQIFAVSFIFDYGNIILFFLQVISPIVGLSLLIRILQYLLSKYYFTMDKGQTLAIDNRKFLFNFMYAMFFYNIINGIFSNVFRFIKAVIFGVWFFPRLDTSLLGRRFEDIDSGFCTYIQFLLIENLQNNPVMVSFLHLVKQKETINNVSINTCELPRRQMTRNMKVPRNRWWLALTLSRNPSLQLLRSHNLEILRALQTRFKFHSNLLNWKLNYSDESERYQSNNSYDIKDFDTFIKYQTEDGNFQFCWPELRNHSKVYNNGTESLNRDDSLLIQID